MSDLFGNPDRLETAQASATAVNLFTATAERIAYEGGFSLRCDDCGTVDDECFCHGATATRIPRAEGGRNVAQVRAEIVFGKPSPYDTAEAALLRQRLGGAQVRLPDDKPLGASEKQTCVTCGAAFLAKPRTPATCNLCRAKVVG